MALERHDKVQDTTLTTGTGTVSLSSSAPVGFRSFVSAVTSGATVRYLIETADKTEWEVGEGVFTDGSPDTLTRVTVYASSNAGSLVNFSAGDKNVSLVLTANDLSTIVEERIHQATEKTTPVDADLFGIVDSAASNVLKKLSFLNLKLAITSWNNPIGTVREFNVSTNPAILLGFGTWAAHGAGRVTVCINASDTEFDTVDETGGAKTHTLTSSESGVPAHSHARRSDGAAEYSLKTATGGSNGFGAGGNSYDNQTNTANNSAANAASAHNNLQPYIVVYRWVRTA